MGSKKMLIIVIAAVLLVVGAVLILRFQGGDFVVCIDPGHGGSDPGTNDSGRFEKDDVLALSLAVRDILEENGVKVLMTRTKDVNVSLEERTDLANRRGATVLVSIHRNGGGGRGVEVWVNGQPTSRERKLGGGILNNIVAAGVSNNRGLRFGSSTSQDEDYWMNRESKMDSCLVELGFMDHEEDNDLFDRHFDEYAEAIAAGILAMR